MDYKERQQYGKDRAKLWLSMKFGLTLQNRIDALRDELRFYGRQQDEASERAGAGDYITHCEHMLDQISAELDMLQQFQRAYNLS